MNPVQIAMQKQRKKIIIGIGAVWGGLWLLLILYLITGQNEAIRTKHISSVTVHSPSPVATNSSPVPLRNAHKAIPTMHYSAPVQWSYIQSAPEATMSGISMRIHESSSAVMHSIGGGNGATAATGGSSGRKGLSYGGNMVVLSSSLALASPGAGRANDIAGTVEPPRPNAGPHVRKVDGSPEIPFPDPIGEVAWGMMVLLALAYAGIIYHHHSLGRKMPPRRDIRR